MPVLNWLNKPLIVAKKGRLAGFFLLGMLSGCQPDWSAQSDRELFKAAETQGGAALELAQRRVAQQQWPAALKWQQKALQLGEYSALGSHLQLLEQMQGFYPAAEFLADWQQAYQSSAAQLAHYGLWQGESPVRGWQAHHCVLQLQPVVLNQASEQHWQQLLQQWQQDTAMSSLPVCFSAAIRANSLELRCSYQPKTRIQCQYQHLAALVRNQKMTQLLVIGGEGGASYNNGILQLAQNSPYSVFRHEFAHVLGFIDEYQLPQATAKDICHRQDIPNLVTDLDALALHQQRFRHQLKAGQLVPVDSCKHAGIQAYALANLSLMRFHDAELNPVYLQLMRQQLDSAEQLMPVHYFYAYKARLAGDMASWEQFMRQAAQAGYPDAKRLLQEYSTAQTSQPARG